MTWDSHFEAFAFTVNANLKTNINAMLHEFFFNSKTMGSNLYS